MDNFCVGRNSGHLITKQHHCICLGEGAGYDLEPDDSYFLCLTDVPKMKLTEEQFAVLTYVLKDVFKSNKK